MKIRTASTLAALALGLMLSGSAAYAAEGNGAQGDQGQHQNGDGDKNDRGDNDKNHHGKPDAKPPVTAPVTAPANTNAPNNANNANTWNNRDGDHTRRVDRRRPKNWNDQNTNRRVVDMSRWHRNANSQRRYHNGSYHAPRGYSYVRYGYGQRLPRDYYARNFWLMDFLNFGLLPPPPGYIWVRYGPDALLIDEETGEIVQVQYDVFYS
jgi:Ni/Co efflux regulator RcnB